MQNKNTGETGGKPRLYSYDELKATLDKHTVDGAEAGEVQHALFQALRIIRSEGSLLERMLRIGYKLTFGSIEIRYTNYNGFSISQYGDENIKVMEALFDGYDALAQSLNDNIKWHNTDSSF